MAQIREILFLGISNKTIQKWKKMVKKPENVRLTRSCVHYYASSIQKTHARNELPIQLHIIWNVFLALRRD